MVNKSYVIISAIYYPEGKVCSIDGMCNNEKAAIALCENLAKNYKKERDKNKLLPKIVWTYHEV